MQKLEYDVTAATFRYVESLWFRYSEMVAKMRDIEVDTNIQTDDNVGIKGKGMTSNPTESQVFRLIHVRQDRQYVTLENNVKAIEYVLTRLPEEYKQVARSRYFTKHTKTWQKIADETGYSKRQAIRIRDMIVVATAEKLGLW